jgi:hypothetical protein
MFGVLGLLPSWARCSKHPNRYFLPLKITDVLDLCVTSLIGFIKNIWLFISPNKFVKKIDSKIFPMILIMYHKY